QQGIRRKDIQPEVIGIPSGIAGVFDGDGIRRIVLAIQESRQAENPIAVRAGGIAAKRNRKQFQRAFLLFESKAIHAPENLVLAKRCGEDRIRRGNRIRGAERSEAGLAIGVEIKVEMPDRGDALFGTFVATRTKRIGSHIDVRPGRVLVRQPAQVTRRKRMFQGSNSLKRLVRRFPLDKKCNRFIRSEATCEEVSGGAGSISSSMVWHVSPRIPAQSGSVWHRGRIREAPELRG